MKSEKKIYKLLNLIRVISFITVLLYHLNIMKGGYLAVCSFFVISGYLSCISFFRKEKISLLEYYKTRLLKLYLPLLIVVFISVGSITFIKELNYINLKPEVKSILLSYNNFWQLKANLDYFTRHVESPFMHLWYISILLQFDLIFPFIFMLLKKMGEKTKKFIPCTIISILALMSTIYFYKSYSTSGMMVSYYNTFSRIYSLLFGVLIGFLQTYYKQIVFKNNIIKNIFFYAYLAILVLLFIFVSAKSNYYIYAMIVSTFITCRLIEYAVSISNTKNNIFDKIISVLSNISYEVYLVQYPVIFIFSYISIKYKLPIMIIIIFIISYLLHYCINEKSKHKTLKYILLSFFIIISLNGVYSFIIAKDHTAEMKELETQLAANEKEIEKKQLEYEANFEKQNEEWNKVLSDLESSEQQIKDIVTNLPIVGIGDSVLLGATTGLYKKFPNGYFDGKVSRTDCEALTIIKSLKARDKLGNTIVLNLGANGSCGKQTDIEIIESVDNRDVYWLNVTNNNSVHFNERLKELSKKYNNLHIIEWNKIAKGHKDYFIADGIHLTGKGIKAYSNAIYDSIYNVYMEKFNKEKEEKINKHNEEIKNKITFYGNDILLNMFNLLKEEYKDSAFNIDKYDYNQIKNIIEKDIESDKLTNYIVFAFDNSIELKINQYLELINLCKNKKIYILNLDKTINIELQNKNLENVIIIDFYKDIELNLDYLVADKIHLSKKGNNALKEKLINIIERN